MAKKKKNTEQKAATATAAPQVPQVVAAPAPTQAAPPSGIPTPPPVAIGFASLLAGLHAGNARIPKFIALALLWTGSKYGTALPAPNNWTGLMAEPTAPKTPDGFAFFPNPVLGLNRAGVILNQKTGGDFSDLDKVAAAVNARFPKLTTTILSTFQKMEV